MATNYIAPTWRMPENSNQSKLSNYSINFDGENSFIDCGSASYLNGLSQFSVSCWFNLNTAASNKTIVSDWFYNSGVKGHFTLQTGSGVDGDYSLLFLVKKTSDVGQNYVTTARILTQNTWNHAVFAYNSGTVTCYINGQGPVSLSTTGTLPTNLTSQDGNLNIGKFGGSLARLWDGKISQVCIFNYELAQSQVTYLYNLNNPMAITGRKPIAYYPLGDNSNPTALAGYPNASVGGSVFNFDGTDDYIDLGTTTAYDTGDLSAAIWVNASSSRTSTVYAFSNSGSPSIAGFDFVIYTNNEIRIRRSTTTKSNQTNQINIGFVSNDWQHLALTYSESTNTLKLFLNGVLKATNVGTNQTNTASEKLTIGSYKGTSSFFNGELSNAQVLNSKLEDSEITTLYNNGTPLTNMSSFTSLQGWWKLDDTATFNSGTSVWSIPDDSSNSNTGSSVGMDSASLVQSDLYRETPYSNYSIKFDGTNSYFEVPFTSDLRLTNVDFTISFWTNPSATGRYIMLENYNPTAAWGVFNDNGAVEFYNSSGWLITGTTIPNNVWTHIALVGDISATNLKVYKNGAEDSSNTSSLVTADATGPLTICAQRNGAGGFDYDGNLSNLSIWSGTALSASEITEIYNAGVPTDLNSFSGTAPTAWWTLDGKKVYYNGSVLVARDAIGTNDATGTNLIQSAIEGNAPGSNGNGTGSSLGISNLKGNMSNSTKNAKSINMADYASGTNSADSGRTTSVPG